MLRESKYTSNSKEISELKSTLDKYVSTKITFTFGENKEILDGTTINKWIIVDDNFQIPLTKAK